MCELCHDAQDLELSLSRRLFVVPLGSAVYAFRVGETARR